MSGVAAFIGLAWGGVVGISGCYLALSKGQHSYDFKGCLAEKFHMGYGAHPHSTVAWLQFQK